VWWHGPEHVTQAQALRALRPDSPLHDCYSRCLMLGSPFGMHNEKGVDGNPHQRHRLHTWPAFYHEFGLETATVGAPCRPRSHITAWRFKEVAASQGVSTRMLGDNDR